ncbi:uncharacterized protein LOC100303819 precursor [Zea mays]|jgi:hypothetical protein|uniref:Atpob1 n=2 Tax=Zea mays TaxID=4577 RepID=B4FZJ5_MAIZE|nr:uncharacterized protein LOC100303819 precursor [Zea mays]ACF87538.1 unknown [Zea mays]AQK80501.1 Atpob1 [Zea mays]|eukprot:NP_001158920.1 uncharacterized protein LOC100303819 precursor [Zea mays]
MAKAPLPLPSLLVLAAFFFHHPCCTAQGRAENISEVEAAVRARASELLRDATSQLVDLPLPANLSGAGVRASALSVRSNALWAGGVNTTGFTVPPRVVPVPFARRLAIVFERFVGNSTAAFAAPQRYALAAPVAGLLAYDASAGPDARVSLRALGAPVRVEFKDDLSAAAALDKGFEFDATTARCVTFAASGEVVATHAVAPGSACAVNGTGHFGIAVLLPETPPPASAVRARWWAWTVGVGAGGVLGASALTLSVAGAVSWTRMRRREEMDRRAMAGEELGRMTVRGSRMPSAKVVRTRPELEERS